MLNLSPGASIRDTYEIERMLGEGAFAEVYRVKHRFLGRQAMKVFKRGGLGVSEVQTMLSEALILSRIGHPNVVRVFDANVLETADGWRGYFTMELVPGGTLHDFWQSHGSRFVPVETAIELLRQVCRGLSTAHREKPAIIHRDIKPQNILVGYEADGLRARVSDFGLAKQVSPLTLFASAAGTLAFKPPEAFGAQGHDSAAADVWALGVTLYLLLTDRLPHKVDPNAGWASQNGMDKAITPPSELNMDADRVIDEIVLRCLQKDPAQRYESALELLTALDRWRPASARSHGALESPPSALGKSQLGHAASPNLKEAEKLTAEALSLAANSDFMAAADLMEEAFNKLPSLRPRYEKRVKLWRCGVSM